MFEKLPTLPVSIETKKEPVQGAKTIMIESPECVVTLDFQCHAPFTKENISAEPAKDTGNPESTRQMCLETFVRLIAHVKAGPCPYRFKTSDGTVWRLETSATHWLGKSGRFEITSKGNNLWISPKPPA